jgi:16S rRNA G527 N7-methylase RsmG
MRAKAKIQTAIVTSRAMTTLKTLVKWVSCLLTRPSAEGAELAAKYSRATARHVNKRALAGAAHQGAGS